MGLFDRKTKTENAVQINDVKKAVAAGIDFWWPDWRKGFKPFGDTFLQMCLNQIYNGVSNITFETTRESVVGSNICFFLDNNATMLANMWLSRGFICVMYNNKGNYRLPDANELRFDNYGRVVNRDAVVIYSPVYQIKRKSYFQLARPLLDLIDNLANTTNETTNTMGVLPIISGNSIPANPAFKKELAEAMSREYGWGNNQMKYFLSQQELKVDNIDMHVKDLELRDNLESAFRFLLDFFEVPVDLVLGNSTYANVETARVYFYESTIRKYAEILLKTGRALVTASPELLPQSVITYRITNVAGVDRTLSDKCTERGAYVDTLLKLKEAGIDVEDELLKVYADLKNDYIEV